MTRPPRLRVVEGMWKLMTTALLLSSAVACTDENVSAPTNQVAPIGNMTVFAYASGRVTEAGSNQPIPSALMDWIGIDAAWDAAGDGVGTDANGTYQLLVGSQHGSPESRRFLIRARQTGYVTQEVEVQLPTPVSGQSRTLTVNFSLQRAS
jgi:hypothetical protein